MIRILVVVPYEELYNQVLVNAKRTLKQVWMKVI